MLSLHLYIKSVSVKNESEVNHILQRQNKMQRLEKVKSRLERLQRKWYNPIDQEKTKNKKGMNLLNCQIFSVLKIMTMQTLT